MRGVGQVGASNVADISSAPSLSSFSLSTAAGWTMLWWLLSVGIILVMFFAL